MPKSKFIDLSLHPEFKVKHVRRKPLWEQIADTPDTHLTPDALDFKQRVHACVAAANDYKRRLENDYLTSAQRTQLNKQLWQAQKEVDQCKEEGNAWKVPWYDVTVKKD